MLPNWRKQLYGNIVGLISQRLNRPLKVYRAYSGTVYLKDSDIEIRISSHLRTRKSDRRHAFDILTKNRRRQYTWEEIRLQVESTITAIEELKDVI